MDLVVGAGKLDRTLENAEALIDAYRTDDGLRYLDYQPITPQDRMVPEDLAVTILSHGSPERPSRLSRTTGHEVALDTLPACALEDADEAQRQEVCDVISTVVAWPGFAASVATKVLHKKRPALIPILDNEAILGAYMSATWPEQRASMDSVYSSSRIREALDWIWFDLTRAENAHEVLADLVGRFDLSWRESFEGFVTLKRKEAVNSIVGETISLMVDGLGPPRYR